MPLCPECRTEQSRRVRGTCPNCHMPVEAYDGMWYRAGTGSPAVAILRYFEDKVSTAMSVGRPNKVVFIIPKIGSRYQRELAASQRLLKSANFDIDLVKETLNILFSDRRFSWKTRNSLLWINGDFTLAMAVALANREAALKRQAEEAKVLQSVLVREDIFS
jgi:hypothetical protein